MKNRKPLIMSTDKRGSAGSSLQILKPVSKQEHEEDPYVSRNVGAEDSRAQPSLHRINCLPQNEYQQQKAFDNRGSHYIHQKHISSDEHSMLYQLRNIDSIQNIQNKQASYDSDQRTLEINANDESNDMFKSSRSPSSG